MIQAPGAGFPRKERSQAGACLVKRHPAKFPAIDSPSWTNPGSSPMTPGSLRGHPGRCPPRAMTRVRSMARGRGVFSSRCATIPGTETSLATPRYGVKTRHCWPATSLRCCVSSSPMRRRWLPRRTCAWPRKSSWATRWCKCAPTPAGSPRSPGKWWSARSRTSWPPACSWSCVRRQIQREWPRH